MLSSVPGNKGPTATPTAAVVFTLFAPVTLGQFAVGNTINRQVHGIQDHHLLVCGAVGIDPAWYHGVATGKMHGRVPHPLNVGVGLFPFDTEQ